jgi:hypothetical protein
MEVAPDFFDYFESFLPVLREDKSLFCVSAWNDNGKRGMVEESKMIFKTDFFPGLGWMTTREFWDEIKPKWPDTYWDDWLRHPNQHQGRGCIRPEVSRTLNFGRIGVSGGLYFDEHIGKIQLSQEKVSYIGLTPGMKSLVSTDVLPLDRPLASKTSLDLKSIDVRSFIRTNYEPRFRQQVYELSSLTSTDELRQLAASLDPFTFEIYSNNANIVPVMKVPSVYDDVNSIYYCGDHCRRRFRLTYKTDNYRGGAWALADQVRLLDEWQLMSDIREDIARVTYLGVVSFKVKLAHPQTLRPAKFEGTRVDKEEFFMVYIAPENE